MPKFRITPIGTCRIHNVLRSAAAKYPIAMHVPRTYGYTHTSLEALQQLDFLEGRLTFPPHLVPVIFRGDSRPEDLTDPWDGADLVMVEISSLKMIEAEGYPLQIRYLSTHFSDFFGSPARNRTYWQLAERDPAGLITFLEADEAFARLPEARRHLLKSISLRQQRFEDLRDDMEKLVERIGADKILFVTHVNALDPSGKQLPARDKLVRWVERAAHDLEAPVFNPTEVMLTHGQDRAMEQGGLDTTHYTESFHGTLYAHLHQHHVAPRAQRVLGGSEDADQALQLQILADAISATIDHVDLVGGARQIHAALRSHPDAPPLIEVRGRFRETVGDHDGALADLLPLHSQNCLGTGSREALMRSLFETGRLDEALAIALRLLQEEHENAGIHLIAANAAEQLGRPELALHHWKALWRLERTNKDAALKAASLASQTGSSSDPEWREELSYFACRDSRLASAFARHALKARDSELFATASDALAEMEPGTAADLLVEAEGSGLTLAACHAVGRVLARTDLPTRTIRTLRDLARGWGDAAVAAAEAQRFEEAARFAAASAEALGNHSGASRALRTVGAMMLPHARELAASGRHHDVLSLLEDKRPVVMARPRLALELVKALIAVGRDAEARGLALEATALFPEDMALALAAARNLKSTDLAEAGRLYARVAEADAEGRHLAEVERFRNMARGLAPAQISEALEALQFDRAIALATLLSDDPSASENERARIANAMRSTLAAPPTHLTPEETSAIGRLLLQLNPNDGPALRHAAQQAMDEGDYTMALTYWQHLAESDPTSTHAKNGIVRCRLLLRDGASNTNVAAAG